MATWWTLATPGRAGATTDGVRVRGGRLRNAFGETGARHERVRTTARGELAIARTPESTGLLSWPRKSPGTTQASPGRIPSRSESATPELSVAGKIALFRSLFRGRDDVYRFGGNRRTGKAAIRPPASRIGMHCDRFQNRNGRRETKKRVNSCLSPMQRCTIISPGRSQSASIRCCPTKPAGSLRWILTSTRGKKMPRHSSIRAASGTFRLHWSARDPAMELTFGFSSQLR